MLSVSSMAPAVMPGSTYGVNTASISGYNTALYSTGNCSQAVQCRKDGQDLNSILSQMGIGMMPGSSQCDVNQAYYYIIIFLEK